MEWWSIWITNHGRNKTRWLWLDWAAINGIGEEGYLEMAEKTIHTTKALIQGVKEIQELDIVGEPKMTIFSFKSNTINVYQLADILNKKGWHFERQHLPQVFILR